jgi:hypothetical protein
MTGSPVVFGCVLFVGLGTGLAVNVGSEVTSGLAGKFVEAASVATDVSVTDTTVDVG